MEEVAPVEAPVETPVEAPVGAVEVREIACQTDKRKMSDKQREALRAGRELYQKNRQLYKQFALEQSYATVKTIEKEEKPYVLRFL